MNEKLYEFAPHAREDVPFLLAEVERLKAGIQRLEMEKRSLMNMLKESNCLFRKIAKIADWESQGLAKQESINVGLLEICEDWNAVKP